jgi:RNA-binding protein
MDELKELTGKQKKFLRGLGNRLEAKIIVGHSGLSANCLKNIDTLLEKEEIAKIRLQPACGLDRHEAAAKIIELTSSVLVKVFGSTVLIYRKSSAEEQIKLP